MGNVDIMIQHVQWVNTQYSMLSPTEKAEFDAKLAEITEQPKTQSQQANLGGETGETDEFENAPEELKRIWKKREKFTQNNRAE
jgi:hypothetical protein